MNDLMKLMVEAWQLVDIGADDRDPRAVFGLCLTQERAQELVKEYAVKGRSYFIRKARAVVIDGFLVMDGSLIEASDGLFELWSEKDREPPLDEARAKALAKIAPEEKQILGIT